jgi:hypothetical protein
MTMASIVSYACSKKRLPNAGSRSRYSIRMISFFKRLKIRFSNLEM